MAYYVVKYIGKRGSTVWNALSSQSVKVKNNEIFLTNEIEAERIRPLTELFEVIQEIELNDLLKNVLQTSYKPYIHPSRVTTRGKILFLFNSEQGKYLGERIWEYQIALILAKMGFNVHILTDEIPPYAAEWPDADIITWERGDATGYTGFDYVIGTPPQNLERAVKYGRKNKISSIIICGELVSSIPGRPESAETLAEFDRVCLSADRIIVPSETVKKSMIQRGAKNGKVMVVSPTVNPNLLLSNPSRKAKEIILCSRMDSHKQIANTIETLLGHPESFGITCISTKTDTLFNKFGEGNKRHNLTFLTKVSEREKAKLFAKASVLVQPSRWEGFGITVLEAMILGTRVTARPLTAFKQIYGEDIDYFTDAKSLFGAVSRALASPNLGTETINKYRSAAQKNRTVILEKLFEKKPINLPVDTSSIALIGWSYKFGGGDIARYEQAKALRKAGYRVQVICWGKQQFPYKGFEVTSLQSVNHLKKWLESNRPGAILCDSGLAGEVVPAAKEIGIPVALFVHFWAPFFRRNHNLLDGESSDDLVKQDKVHLLKDASAVFVNSEYSHEVFRKHLAIDAPIVFPAVNAKRLQSKSKKLKREIILTPILEGEPNGLKLFESILESLPNRHFVVLYWRGTDEDSARLKDKYPNLTLLNGVEQVARYYKSAKLLLYPLQVDHSFGLSFCESLLLGTPVLAPKLGNIPYLVNKGGILFDSMNSTEWVEEIEKCFTDSKHYDSLRRGAIIDSKKLPVTDYSPLLDHFEALFARVRQVSFFKGEFLASKHAFGAYARLLDGVGLDAPQSQVTIAFGPPKYWSQLISPRTYCFWASTPLQSQVDNELRFLEETVTLVKSGHLAGIISPSKDILIFAKSLGCTKLGFLRVPAPVLSPLKKVKRERNHVSLFMGQSPRKNIINQILAVIKANPNITLHISESVLKGVPDSLLNAVNVVRHPYLEDDRYFTIINSCSAGLQVTVGETFNQAAFQHFSLGTPCLIGKSCPYHNDLPNEFKYLVVSDVEDVEEIAAKLKIALNEKNHSNLSDWAHKFAEGWNKEMKKDFAKIFS